MPCALIMIAEVRNREGIDRERKRERDIYIFIKQAKKKERKNGSSTEYYSPLHPLLLQFFFVRGPLDPATP